MSSNFVQVKPMYLQQIVGTGDTQFKFKASEFVDLSGNPLTMADFGTEMYGTMGPNTPREEAVLVTGVSAPSLGYVTFTVTRALKGKPPYGTGGTAYPHDPGEVFVISNSPDLMKKFMQSDANASITGDWLFPNPTAQQNVVTKAYYETTLAAALTPKLNKDGVKTVTGQTTFQDEVIVPQGSNPQNPATRQDLANVANFGAANATETIPGIVQYASQDEVDNSIDVDPVTGAPLVVAPSRIPKTPYAAPSIVGIVRSESAVEKALGNTTLTIANPTVLTPSSMRVVNGDIVRIKDGGLTPTIKQAVETSVPVTGIVPAIVLNNVKAGDVIAIGYVNYGTGAVLTSGNVSDTQSNVYTVKGSSTAGTPTPGQSVTVLTATVASDAATLTISITGTTYAVVITTLYAAGAVVSSAWTASNGTSPATTLAIPSLAGSLDNGGYFIVTASTRFTSTNNGFTSVPLTNTGLALKLGGYSHKTNTAAETGVVITASSSDYMNAVAIGLTLKPTGATLPSGLAFNTDYRVVNATPATVQLATSVGGTPIGVTGSLTGRIYLERKTPAYNVPIGVFVSQLVPTNQGSSTAVQFHTKKFDDNNFFSADAPTRITFNTPGRYMVGGNIFLAANTSMVKIVLNGTISLAGNYGRLYDFSYDDHLSVTTTYEFNAGDYVELFARTDNPTTSGDISTNFWANKIA